MKLSIFSFLLLTLLAFSSCEKGNLVDKSENEEYKEDGKDECFALVYPVTYNLPDGTSVTGDEKEVWTTIKAWYENHPDSEEKPALQYPVDIIFKEEITKTIDTEEEMGWAKKACKGDKKECFKLVYPISYTLPDGSTLTGDEKEVWIAIKTWYQANPDAEEKPSLLYPVDIVFEDGTTQTIDDEAEMVTAKEACESEEDDEG